MKIIATALFAIICQYSLADTIYDYDLAIYGSSGLQAPAPGAPFSGRISFSAPRGEEEGFSSICALEFTTAPHSGTSVSGAHDLPEIPSETFSLADVTRFSGGLSWDGSALLGDWNMVLGDISPDSVYASLHVGDTHNFFPFTYQSSDFMASTRWQFAGTRNVPESQGTLLYLFIAVAALAGCAKIKMSAL